MSATAGHSSHGITMMGSIKILTHNFSTALVDGSLQQSFPRSPVDSLDALHCGPVKGNRGMLFQARKQATCQILNLMMNNTK